MTQAFPAPTRATTPTASPPTGRAWLVTALVVVLMMINFGDKAVLGLAAQPIMDELNLTATQFGGVSSSFYLLFSLSGLCVGFISSRVSTKTILGVIAISWSVVTLPILLVATLPVLYASRILLGAAEGPSAAMTAHAVQKWFPAGKRALPTAMTSVGGGLGLVVMAPLLGYFIANHGWRSAFLVLTVLGVAWAAVWMIVGREGPYAVYESSRHGTPSTEHDTAAPAEKRVRYLTIFTSRTFLGGLIAGIGVYWALAFATSWLPALLEKGRGYSAQTASFLVSAPSVLSVIAVLVCPVVSERLMRRGVSTRGALAIPAGALVAVPGVAGLFVGGAHGGLMVALICIALGLPGAYFTLWFLNIDRISPVAQRGAVLGTGIAVASLAGIVAPIVTGRLLDGAGGTEQGFGTAFAVTAAALIICGLVGMFAMHPDKDAERFGLRGSA